MASVGRSANATRRQDYFQLVAEANEQGPGAAPAHNAAGAPRHGREPGGPDEPRLPAVIPVTADMRCSPDGYTLATFGS